MTKKQRIEEERLRLNEIFKDIDQSKKELAEGLINQAAYLEIEIQDLESSLIETGMIEYHPKSKAKQRPIAAADQYRKNVNSYANIIKTLNGILSKSETGEDDPFSEWLKEQHNKRESEQQ